MDPLAQIAEAQPYSKLLGIKLLEASKEKVVGELLDPRRALHSGRDHAWRVHDEFLRCFGRDRRMAGHSRRC